MTVVRHPVIVLEGPDAAGKTTMADAIRAHSGARYVHMTWRMHKTPEQFFQYQMACTRLALRLARDTPVVLDRWWCSEKVYGPEFRASVLNDYAWRLLDRVGQRYGFNYLFCIPSDKGAHELRHGERASAGGEMYTTLGNLTSRYARLYADLYSGGREVRDDVCLYDCDSVPLADVPSVAASLYEAACDRLSSLYDDCSDDFRDFCLNSADRTWVGSPRPRVAVLADFRASPAPRLGHWPSCAYYHGPSRCLLDDTAHSGAREEDIIWVDTSCGLHWGRERREDVSALLDPVDHVLSLGADRLVLESLVGRNDSRVTRLAKPQFYRDFGGTGLDVNQYCRALQKSLGLESPW